MSGLLDTLTSAGQSVLGASGTQLIFKSNITPDIKIDVAQLLNKNSTQPPQQTVQSDSPGALALIRPQIALTTGVGIDKVIAPYGPPIKNAWLLAVVVLGASGLIGARIAWAMCRRVPPKKKPQSS